ncbi:MAG: ribosome recycling factor [Malacoplasma sp.]|nr:ribosome recycling factor [Malacoplasma sp.]
MEWNIYKQEFESKMIPKMDWLDSELNKIKSGRPNPKIFDGIVVNAYDSKMKLYEVANWQVVHGKEIIIKPYDKSLLHEINSAIAKENLGLNVQVDADSLKVSFPPQTEDSRKASVKKAKEIIESAKVEVRNVRKDIHQKLKKDEALREDELKWYEEELDKLTKSWNAKIDKIFVAKEHELMSL